MSTERLTDSVKLVREYVEGLRIISSPLNQEPLLVAMGDLLEVVDSVLPSELRRMMADALRAQAQGVEG